MDTQEATKLLIEYICEKMTKDESSSIIVFVKHAEEIINILRRLASLFPLFTFDSAKKTIYNASGGYIKFIAYSYAEKESKGYKPEFVVIKDDESPPRAISSLGMTIGTKETSIIHGLADASHVLEAIRTKLDLTC